MIRQRSRESGTGVSGGAGTLETRGRATGPDRSALVAAPARALLQRMVNIPGQPQTPQALAEEEAIHWILRWTGPDHPSDQFNPMARRRHQLALLRRYHRTSDTLGKSNRYSLAIMQAYTAAGRL